MAIPISYNLRNLMVRRTTTLLTAAGISLTVVVLLMVLSLGDGLRATFRLAGNPLNILILRKGSTSELSSAMSPETFRELLFRPGVAREPGTSHPMVSLELVTVIRLPAPGNPRGMSVTLRGLLPVGVELRDLKLLAGRWFQYGQREVAIGKAIATRYPGAHVGGTVRFGKHDWQIVGLMDGGTSPVNSEIFGDLNQVSADFNRSDRLSSVLLRAEDPVAAKAVMNSITDDARLNATAQRERDYYARQTASGGPLETLGVFVSVIMAIGSSFAAMNTMYAVVSRRTKEIGTLRILGFSRGSILLCFLVESTLLAAMGGLIGCLATLPLNNVTTAIGNSVTMSEIAVNFRVSPTIMLAGVFYASLMGLAGGFLPAWAASKKEILAAIRDP